MSIIYKCSQLIPGRTSFVGPLGATTGGVPKDEFLLSEAEGIGVDESLARSLSHNSEQLVFQNPIFWCSRSYITRVLRTITPVWKIYNYLIGNRGRGHFRKQQGGKIIRKYVYSKA